mmetsp:Transcript_49043/g.59367  ORF Transcript_49043/g.59367 Transcript_49043/m.59367 type:complete len:236 (-) Transcript_49043:245-952(-)
MKMMPQNNVCKNDEKVEQTYVTQTRTQIIELQRSNILCMLAKETIGEIFSFLAIKDIANFRATHKYSYNNIKLSYTEGHCRFITDNLLRIYAQGGLQGFRKILSDDSRVNPSTDNNWLIQWASENGHLDLVQMLLKDERVDPSAGKNNAIRSACYNGHSNVVQLLLQDSRVDPSALHNRAIRSASENGHLDVVRVLLTDSRVNPAARHNLAMYLARENGHLDVVQELMKNKKKPN